MLTSFWNISICFPSNLNPNLTDNFLGTLYTKVVFNSVINTICTLFEIRMGQFIDYEGAETDKREVPDLNNTLFVLILIE